MGARSSAEYSHPALPPRGPASLSSSPTSCCPVAPGPVTTRIWKLCLVPPTLGHVSFQVPHSALDHSPPKYPPIAPTWRSIHISLPAVSSRMQTSPGGQLSLHAVHGQCMESHSATVTLGAQLDSVPQPSGVRRCSEPASGTRASGRVPSPTGLPGPCELQEQSEKEPMGVLGQSRSARNPNHHRLGPNGTGPTRVYSGGGEGAETCSLQHKCWCFTDASREGARTPRPQSTANRRLDFHQEERVSQWVDNSPVTAFSMAAIRRRVCTAGALGRARTGESKQRRACENGQDGPASAQRCLPVPHSTHQDTEEQPCDPPGPQGLQRGRETDALPTSHHGCGWGCQVGGRLRGPT